MLSYDTWFVEDRLGCCYYHHGRGAASGGTGGWGVHAQVNVCYSARKGLFCQQKSLLHQQPPIFTGQHSQQHQRSASTDDFDYTSSLVGVPLDVDLRELWYINLHSEEILYSASSSIKHLSRSDCLVVFVSRSSAPALPSCQTHVVAICASGISISRYSWLFVPRGTLPTSRYAPATAWGGSKNKLFLTDIGRVCQESFLQEDP